MVWGSRGAKIGVLVFLAVFGCFGVLGGAPGGSPGGTREIIQPLNIDYRGYSQDVPGIVLF